MPIPDYQELMLPLLNVLSDGKSKTVKELTETLSERFTLTPEERSIRLKSGSALFVNRIAWAKVYLKKAGLIENMSRGVVAITEEGKSLLRNKPLKITNELLKQYDSFRVFKTAAERNNGATGERQEGDSPEETLLTSFETMTQSLADDLLDKVKQCTPVFFEQLVVDLLVAMGYGGSLEEAARKTRMTADGGIDGVIKEDKLGLDVIVLQAKRWEATVGRPDVQAFAGSMEGHRARKGVFLTTSSFSKDALDYVERIERKIILIDGKQLAELMIEHNVGVSVVQKLEIKRIDTGYFDSLE